MKVYVIKNKDGKYLTETRDWEDDLYFALTFDQTHELSNKDEFWQEITICEGDLEEENRVMKKALELACKDVHDLTQNQIGIELCYECEHFDLCNKISNVDRLDLECEQVFAIAYKNKAEKEMSDETAE